MAQYPTQQQQQTWKYTPPAVPQTTQSTSTKDWHQFVDNQGITNWEDHLRSQGIDPLVSIFSCTHPTQYCFKWFVEV